MEMWKILTQKFKAQSLDEDQSFQPLAMTQVACVEEKDSGTESDENAELQAIEEAMQSKRDQENFQPQVLTSVGQLVASASSPKFLQSPAKFCQSPARFCQSPTRLHQLPLRSSFSPVGSVSKRPFQLVNQQNLPHYSGIYHDYGRDSPIESSDYERCSLDYEPGSSTDFDHHSSEEELTIINCRGAEKRKWSQMNRCHSCDDSSGSSDEELRDLLCEPRPLNFSSSPPKGVQRLSQALSPTLFLANLAPKNMRLCTVSPRKRHRVKSSGDGSDSSVMQRPCLDFEKMQKTLFRKHVPHGVTKARIVKIRVGVLKGAM